MALVTAFLDEWLNDLGKGLLVKKQKWTSFELTFGVASTKIYN